MTVDPSPATQPIEDGCGHPNHGAADHDCTPFLPDSSAPATQPGDDGREERRTESSNERIAEAWRDVDSGTTFTYVTARAALGASHV